MSVERLHISNFLSAAKDAILIDVRSPAEYKHAHVPGAISLPLFTDEERKVVGTTYKQVSREAAIKIGLDYFGPKMRKMVEEVEELQKKQNTDTSSDQKSSNKICVYCWRGGMRSGAVSWLLDLYGFKVYTLAGGYKTFREKVLQTFEQSFSLHVLGGYTGTGKSELLLELERQGETVIHLETLASHKGSAFGNINMPPQPTQEMFENLLATELWDKGSREPVWIEDESQRIGDRNVPIRFWELMQSSPLLFLDVPFEQRLDYILQGYSSAPVERLEHAIGRISKRLGGLETKNALNFLKEGNLKDCFRILLTYYDKRYLKSLNNRPENSVIREVKCSSISIENTKKLLLKFQTL